MIGTVHDRFDRIGAGVAAIGSQKVAMDGYLRGGIVALRPELAPKLVGVPTPGSKEERLETLGPNAQSHWLRCWEPVWEQLTLRLDGDQYQELSLGEQWREFPNGKHDDKLDGVFNAVRGAREFSGTRTVEVALEAHLGSRAMAGDRGHRAGEVARGRDRDQAGAARRDRAAGGCRTTDEMWTPDAAIQPPENLEALSALSQRVAGFAPRRSRRSPATRSASATPSRRLPNTPTPGIDDKQQGRCDAHPRRAGGSATSASPRPTSSSSWSRSRPTRRSAATGRSRSPANADTGQIDGLFHAPGKRVRRLKDRTRLHHRPLASNTPRSSRESVRFYEFGDKVQYDEQRRADEHARSPAGKWATNELIVFQLYTSASGDYGLPRDVELAVEYLAALNLQKWMAAFFGGSGSLPTLLFVQGVETKDGTKITYRVPQETDRPHPAGAFAPGSSQSDRIAIIPLPPEAQAQLHELAHVSDRDITFDTWTSNHEQHVLGCFRLGPVFVAQESRAATPPRCSARSASSRSSTRSRRATRGSSTTRSCRTSARTRCELKFKRLAIESDAAKRDSADALAAASAITMGEYRTGARLAPARREDSRSRDQRRAGGTLDKRAQRRRRPRRTLTSLAPAAQGDQRGQRPGHRRSRRAAQRRRERAGLCRSAAAADRSGARQVQRPRADARVRRGRRLGVGR